MLNFFSHRERRVCRSMTMKFTYSLFLSIQNFTFLSKFLSIKASFGDLIQLLIFCTVS